jgi:hypothetical protein
MSTKNIIKRFQEMNTAERVAAFDRLRGKVPVNEIYDSFRYRVSAEEQVGFFNQLRARGYRLAEEIIARSSFIPCPAQFRLTSIDETAKAAWKYQWKPLLGKDAHSDDRYYKEKWFEDRCPTYGKSRKGKRVIESHPHHFWFGRFEAAIWQGTILCGLSSGGGNEFHSEYYVSLDVTEGHPHFAHPLKQKIYDISLIAAAAYANVLGFEEVSRTGPFSKGSIKQAERRGLIGKKELLEWREYGSAGSRIVVPVGRVIRNKRFVLEIKTLNS